MEEKLIYLREVTHDEFMDAPFELSVAKRDAEARLHFYIRTEVPQEIIDSIKRAFRGRVDIQPDVPAD